MRGVLGIEGSETQKSKADDVMCRKPSVHQGGLWSAAPRKLLIQIVKQARPELWHRERALEF